MKEVLFRGKSIDGNWYYGVPLVFTENYVFIAAPYTCNKNVEMHTVGQYTGLTDKNGKKVFEGDIVKYSNGYGHIAWAELHGAFMCVEENGEYWEWISNMYDIEIIGNIHDNPELLKGVKK